MKFVAAGGAEAIENLEVNQTAKFGGFSRGKHPSGVEITDSLERGQNRRLRGGRSEDNEVLSETRIVGMEACEVKIEEDERRHQVGFTRAHGKAEEVVRVIEVVEKRVEELGPIRFGTQWIVAETLSEGWELIGLCKTVKELCGRVSKQGGLLVCQVTQCA